MFDIRNAEVKATFCDPCCNGCPQVVIDHGASHDRRIVVTDDFGSHIRMSPEQFASMVKQAKTGALDCIS